MKRIAVVTLAAVLFGATASAALAEPPGVEVKGTNTQSGNCIAIFSSFARHNGQAPTLGQGGDPSHGTRGDEIKFLQDLCNNAGG